ncbi:glycoside hydrolase family 31 protein [Xylariomycetidae sp. FL2044]|nr:glycoside hydrolase family 31 protein [Xylariomycetidae sp. FL2044]
MMPVITNMMGCCLSGNEGLGSFIPSFLSSWALFLLDFVLNHSTTWFLELNEFHGSRIRILVFASIIVGVAFTAVATHFRVSRRWILSEMLAYTGLCLLVLVLVTSAQDDDGQPVLPNIIDPEAVNPQTVCPGYKASNVQETKSGLTADLTLAGSPCNVYGTDVETLSLLLEYQAADRLHVEILPKYIGQENYTWFILPEKLYPKPDAKGDCGDCASRSDIEYSWSNDPTFSFKVTRKSNGDTLFTTEGTQLVYEDQFIEFGSSLPENYNLYGLGEVIHGFRLGNNLTRTFFAADVGDIIDANIYGSHPVYLDTRYFQVDGDTGNFTYVSNATDTSRQYKSYTHGLFQRNAHIQEVLLRESNITWRALGGTVDLYFYQGPSQDEIIKAYQHSAVGLPAMQQYWTLGYHQCRWGYENWTVLQDVVDNFAQAQIPLETMWSDIDYMKAYRDFENDPVRYSYSEGAEFLSRLHDNGQHYVPIIDSAIYAPDPTNASDAYPPFDRGIAADAFMLNPDGSIYIGEVWPGSTVFPDWIGALFNGTGANTWWIAEIAEYFKKIAFDGIWIDMSEVSSFCVGSCGSNRSTLASWDPDPTSAPSSTTTTSTYLRTTPTPGVRNINYPPYTVNNYNGDLAVHAVSPNATHHGGTVEYDFHNLFGYQILNATYHALLGVYPTKRPFIIGRSQFAGAGKWAGHWGGDNYSLWAFMYFSIPQALSFSLFGIPMFGVDTCGFAGDADAELCSRWMQLSAFFPFYRNHNVEGATSQEPYVWPKVAEASRVAMQIRYALLPYLYTVFYLSHATGSTTMRALAWEFPDEPWLAAADRQFLLGPAVMVTPCLVQGATTVDGVFPGVGGVGEDGGQVWYDWYNQTAVTGVTIGQNVTIDAPLGHIPVYLRGGHVVPMQEPGLTTAAVRASPWSLLVGLNGTGAAVGGLYVDDGESLVVEESLWVDFTVSNKTLSATPTGTFTDANVLGNVTVLGVSDDVTRVRFQAQDLARDSWAYDALSKVLRVTRLDGLTEGGAWVEGWELNWG